MTSTYTGVVPLDDLRFTREALAAMVGQRPRMLSQGNYLHLLATTTITEVEQVDDTLHLTFTIDEVAPDEYDASLTLPPEQDDDELPLLAAGFRVEREPTTSPDPGPVRSALVSTLWWTQRPTIEATNIYPPSLWLRGIEFLDGQAENGLRPPTHTTRRIRFNGRDVDPDEVPIATHEPVLTYTKGGLGESETIVSFVVAKDALRIPPLDADGVPSAEDAIFKIGSLNVLAPNDRNLMWQPAQPDDDTWWRVWVLVAEVAFLGSRA